MDSQRQIAVVEERLAALESAISTLFAKNVGLVAERPEVLDERASVTIWLDARFDHPAFYAQELRPDGVSFRWMGQGDEAELTVPISRRRPRRVDVFIPIFINDEALRDFTIACDGRRATGYEERGLPEGILVKSATFDAAGGDQRATDTRLTLSIGTKVDLTPQGDPRTLAVALNRIVVTEL